MTQHNKPDRIYRLWSISNWLYRHRLTPLAILMRAFIRILFSADIPYKLQIGKGTRFPHDALGSLFHPDAIIGTDCTILHGVTIGGRSGHKQLPVIGNNVRIGTHAQILGPITIGNNAEIGAGAVVVKSVPDCAIVAGVPAKILKIKDLSHRGGN